MTNRELAVSGIRIAMQMERRGRQIYQRAMRYAEDEKMRALLQELIDEETVHYGHFAQMLEAMGEAGLSDELQEIEIAKAAEHFFPGGLMQVAMDGALCSAEAMIQEAEKAERDSIAYYRTLRGHVGPENGKILDAILAEEETHLSMLEKRHEKGDGE